MTDLALVRRMILVAEDGSPRSNSLKFMARATVRLGVFTKQAESEASMV